MAFLPFESRQSTRAAEFSGEWWMIKVHINLCNSVHCMMRFGFCDDHQRRFWDEHQNGVTRQNARIASLSMFMISERDQAVQIERHTI